MRTALLLFFLLPGGLLLGQVNNSNDRFEGTLGGNMGVSSPTGEFDDAWGRNMFHLGAHLGFPMGRVPLLQGGFAFGYSVMGKNEAEVPINTDYLNITVGTLTTRSKVFSYHPLIRLSPLSGKVRPYVDAMIGFRQFSTTSTVTADGVEENISKERDETDIAFSRGWAAGVMTPLGDVAYLEVRVERLNSGEATYVDPTSVTVSDQGVLNFNTRTSNTDVTNVMLGVGFRF
jgi:hypothetical protein